MNLLIPYDTLLLASMILCYNQERYAVWLITIKSGNTGHIAVAFPVQGEKLCILDPAGNYYTNQWGFLSSDDVSIAVQDWLSKWQAKMPGAEVTAVFNHNIYQEFSDTEEFIQWVINR